MRDPSGDLLVLAHSDLASIFKQLRILDLLRTRDSLLPQPPLPPAVQLVLDYADML